MFSLKSFFNAIANAARSFNDLAATVDEARANFRENLGLDRDAEETPVQLEHSSSGNGKPERRGVKAK